MSTPLLADLLRTVAAEEPEREAYVHGEKRATYGWLDRVADGFATTLLEHGGRKNAPAPCSAGAMRP